MAPPVPGRSLVLASAQGGAAERPSLVGAWSAPGSASRGGAVLPAGVTRRRGRGTRRSRCRWHLRFDGF